MVWPFKRKPKPETPQVAAPVEEGAAAPRTTPETIPRPIVQEQVPQARAAEMLKSLNNLPLEEQANRALQAANQMRRSLARAGMDIRLEIISQTNGTADFSRPETLGRYAEDSATIGRSFQRIARIEERLMALQPELEAVANQPAVTNRQGVRRPNQALTEVTERFAAVTRELEQLNGSISTLESALATKFKASAAEQMRQLSQRFSRLLFAQADDETRREIAGLVGGRLHSKIVNPGLLSDAEAEGALKALIESGVLSVPTERGGCRARDFLLERVFATGGAGTQAGDNASRFIMRQIEFGAINGDALASNIQRRLNESITQIARRNPTQGAALERLLEIVQAELSREERDTIRELGGGRVLENRLSAIEDRAVRGNVRSILQGQDGRLRTLVESRFALEAGGKPPSGTVDSALESAAQVARARYKVVLLTVAAVAVASGVAYLENKVLPERSEDWGGWSRIATNLVNGVGVGALVYGVATLSQRHWVTDEWQLRRVMQFLKERLGSEGTLAVGAIALYWAGSFAYDAYKGAFARTKPGEQEYSGVQKFAYEKLREKYGERDNYSEYEKALGYTFAQVGSKKDRAASESRPFDWETSVRDGLRSCKFGRERLFTDQEVEEIIGKAKQTGETEQSQKTKDDWVAAIRDTNNGLNKRVRQGGFVYFPSVGDRQPLMDACIAGVEDAFTGTNNPTKADVRAQMENQLKAQNLDQKEVKRFLDAIGL